MTPEERKLMMKIAQTLDSVTKRFDAMVNDRTIPELVKKTVSDYLVMYDSLKLRVEDIDKAVTTLDKNQDELWDMIMKLHVYELNKKSEYEKMFPKGVGGTIVENIVKQEKNG
jgi:hypothetical protein